MRRLPAALFAAVSAVPVLTSAAGLPAGLPATLHSGLPAGLVATATGTAGTAGTAGAAGTGAGAGAGARMQAPGAAPAPVATTVRQVALSGVDPAADRSLAAVRPAFGHGAPGALALMATSTPAVLTKELGTAGFQTLGVTWALSASRPQLLISVRTRGPAGWSGWDELDDDAGDDPASVVEATSTIRARATAAASASAAKGPAGPAPAVRGGTDPLWVGPSTGVQVRIVVRAGKLPADLKLELVDPGTSSHDPLAAAGGSLAAASANQPPVISRAQWGADESRVRYAPTYMPTIKAAVLHHTAGRNNYSASQVPAMIRGDYAYHLSRGWSDIGYNALVDRFGRIWEGRAGGLSRAVMGAHAGGFNTDTFGVAMLGNYDVSRPSAASISAVAQVMAWKLDLAHRDPFGSTRLTSAGGGTARYRAGRTVTLPVIMGHRNTGFTACPGRYLYPYLGSIRRQVRGLMKAALLNPSSVPSEVPRGAAVSITAQALAAQDWQLDVSAPFGGGRVARTSGSGAAGATIKARWDGRVSGGAAARPGRYRLTLTSSSARGVARPVVEDVLVVPPDPAPEVPSPPSTGPGGFFPVTPTRLLDTRTGGRVGLGPDGRVDIPVLGRAGVPLTAVTSVVLNLTASGVSDDTSLTVWPTGRSSNRILTGVPAGTTRSMLVTTRVGGGGTVSVGNAHGVTELTVDVIGYFAAVGATVRSIDSTRIYNSRLDPAGALVAGQARSVPLPALLGGIPASQITGLVVDASVLSPTGSGTLSAYQPGTAGTLATLNYRAGESIDNLAVVQVAGGAIAVRSSGGPANVVLDVRAVLLAPGQSAGPARPAGSADPAGSGTVTAVKPVPALDTRTTGGAISAGRPRSLVVTGSATGVPASARAVLVNLTAIRPAAKTWLQLYAGGRKSTGGTALRVSMGDTRGNLVLVPLGPGGTISVANARGAVQVRVDVYGYLS